MSKNENRIRQPEAEETAKPLQKFFFPEQGVTIEATTIEEATEKLNNQINK